MMPKPKGPQHHRKHAQGACTRAGEGRVAKKPEDGPQPQRDDRKQNGEEKIALARAPKALGEGLEVKLAAKGRSARIVVGLRHPAAIP